MEPRREEQQRALGSSAEQKPRRFRIIKLEERVAPRKSGGTNGANCYTHKCTGGCPNTIGSCTYVIRECW